MKLFIVFLQLGLLTGSIRLLKSQRSKPDPILCMSLLYLTKIRPNMFAHETVTQCLCTLLKREQGAAFKNKGNPLVYILACNMLYAGHRESNNWPDIFIKVCTVFCIIKLMAVFCISLLYTLLKFNILLARSDIA